MMIGLKETFFVISLAISSIQAFAQEDLLSMLDSAETVKIHEKVTATFKGGKVINMQSVETVKAKTLDFNVTHRFSNIGGASGGGPHTFFGLDNSTDIRIAFDFGITDKLTIGIGRSKQKEDIDGLAKYRIFSQTTDNHIPISITLYGDMSYSAQTESQFYKEVKTNSGLKHTDIHRFAYTGQVLIARKFSSSFSMEIVPTFQHRNFVIAYINENNGAAETNDLFSMGAGFRYKITKRFSIIADYYYTFSKYRTNNKLNPFYNPLALGIEIETGGHVFHINYTNASGIIENNYLPNTTDSWLKGGYKWGFNISRVFYLGHKKPVEQK